MLLFSVVLIFCEHYFPMDGQIFQVFSGLLTGISGAFLMRIKPRGLDPSGDPAPTKTTTTVDQNAGTVVQQTQVGKSAEPEPNKPEAQ